MRLPTIDPLTVLVVEDDVHLCRTLRDILKRKAYWPLTAGSGLEALGLIGRDKALPAIALVDLKLPDMDGMELIGHLREVSALTEAIVLTGNASIDSAVRALREHTYDYLVKPVAPPDLLATMERAGERWQRRRAEEALRHSEERSQRLLEHISDIVAVIDERLMFRYVSPSITTVLGHSGEDVVGRPCLEFTHPDDHRLMHQCLRGSAAAQTSEVVRLRHRNGDWRLVEITATGSVNQSDLSGLILTARDVTDRRRLEEELRQAQKMESIGRLAGGVAHDFNNLLTAILGFSEILLDSSKPGTPTHQDLAAIRQAAQHGASLTRQLLAFSRRQMLEPAILDLGELAKALESILRRLMGEDVDIHVSGDADLAKIKADRGQIEQVLMNLAVNARDAMPQGGMVRIETHNVIIDERGIGHDTLAIPGPYVMLAVNDTGTGMDEATRVRIFEPFFTTKEQGKGTGLGLSTVYGIVKQSGGYIEVQSETGVGTTFKLYFPAVESEVENEASAVTADQPQRGAGTVLLVEDDALLRELLRRSLERGGYAVIEASCAGEALRLTQEELGDLRLLVTDAVMPGMSGPALAPLIASRVPGVRVLFISGYSDDAMLRLGVLNDHEAFLQKPFGPKVFLEKVREMLDVPPS